MTTKEKQDLRDSILQRLDTVYKHPLFMTVLKDKQEILLGVAKDVVLLAEE